MFRTVDIHDGFIAVYKSGGNIGKYSGYNTTYIKGSIYFCKTVIAELTSFKQFIDKVRLL